MRSASDPRLRRVAVGAATASSSATAGWNRELLFYVRRSTGIDASAIALAIHPQCQADDRGKRRPGPRPECEAASCGVIDRVIFTGDGGPWPYYASADLFAVPSREEFFGNVLVEALYAGLPIVSTDTTGGREVLEATAGDE